MAAAVGANLRPDFAQPRPQGCCAKIVNVAKKIVAAVAAFFMTLIRFILCLPEPRQQIPWNWNRPPIRPPLNLNWDNDLIFEPPLDGEAVNDAPVDLEAFRAALRDGYGNPPISSRMTPADFSALCEAYPIRVTFRKGHGPVLREEVLQEAQMIAPILEQVKQGVAQEEGVAEANRVEPRIDFPPERTRIAQWAQNWARAREKKVDPAHPYFEIIQEAFRNRDAIPGGRDSSADYTTYSPPSQNYYANTNQFTYTVMSLIGFQELSRPENIALFHKLDNWSLENGQNPAYCYASAASNIYTYPKAGGLNVDVRQKLQSGLGAASAAYETAKNTGRIPEFFQNCFHNNNCFDARVMQFQEFNLQNMHPNFEDFNPKVVHRDTVATKITRYAAVFRHELIDQYVRAHPEAGLTYQEFKAQVDQGRNNRHVQAFDASYTRDRFAEYLQRNNHPVREKEQAAADLHRIHGVAFDRDKAFLEIANVDAIPPAYRVVDRLVALRDFGTWCKARVHKVEPNRIILDLRGDPVKRAAWEAILNAAYMM